MTTIVFSIGVISIYAAIVVVQTSNHALQFDGFAMNGAFQALNPLNRIANGQVIGRDFQFFHGLGIPLIHYPLFIALGADLTASEVARWLLLPTLFAASTILFFRAVYRKWWVTLLASSLTLMFCLWKLPGIVYPENSSLGLRSLTAVFIMIALLYRQRLTRKVISTRLGSYFNYYQLTVAFLLVASFLCGTEQGVAAGIAFTIVSLRYPRDTPFRLRLASLSKVVGLATVLLLAMLTAITRGHPFAPLQFALVDVPTDQAWYFGAPPNDFLQYSNIFQLLSSWFTVIVLVATILTVALLYELRKHPFIAERLDAFMFGILAGLAALMSVFGYFSPAQFIPLARMNLLILTTLGAYGIFIVGKSLATRELRLLTTRQAYAIAAILTIVFCSYLATVMAERTLQQFRVIELAKQGYHHFVTRTDSENLGVGWQSTMHIVIPEVNADNFATVIPKNNGGYTNGVSLSAQSIVVKSDDYARLLRHGQVVYLPISGRHRVADATTSGHQTIVRLEKTRDMNISDGESGKIIIGERLDKEKTRLWATYTALFESEMRTLQPTPGYDYIIHALGEPARRQYVDAFDNTQPEFAVTMRRDYAVFEEWVQYTSWDFYQRVVDNYEPTKVTGSHVLWQRKPDQSWKKPDYTQLAEPLESSNARIQLPTNQSDKPRLVVIRPSYQVGGLASKLPVVGNAPRYLLKPHNTASTDAISLPPYMSEWQFPIFLKPNSSDAYLEVSTASLIPGAQLNIIDVTYQEQPVTDATIQALLDSDAAFKL